MKFVDELASLSNCKRLKVGAIVIPSDMTEVVSIGYNGPASGENNDTCRKEEGNCGCIHGEANAVVKLRSRRKDLIMICTDSPCEHCAGMIINQGGIKAVLYDREYRVKDGVQRLKNRKIITLGWEQII